MLDLDGLKGINDEYGHMVGDQALQMIATTGKKQLRVVDFFGRLSGDEFLIVLVETNLNGGRSAAERIRQSISEASIDTPSGLLKVSVCIGIAAMSEKYTKLTDLLRQADTALLKAKKAGRNQIGVGR
jgi:diguanylate cyclase (GGDEF)-like protein